MRVSPRTGFLIAILLSLFMVHLPLVVLVISWQRQAGGRLAHSNLPAPVVTIDLTPAAPQRIADLDKPLVEEVPDKPSVQSLYNSKVAQETVAMGRRKKPSGTPQKTPSLPKTAASQSGAKKAEAPQKTATPGGKALSLADEIKSLKAQKTSKVEETLAKLTAPQPLAPATGSQSGPSGDFLPGFKIGNHTYLNALANPRIAYFVELKRKFEFTWNPVPVLRRNLHQISRGEVRVVWGITVNGAGQLKDMTLISGSGLGGYDAEARRAITASAPFSRPPENLKEKDGNVYMAWTFVYYL